MAIPRGETQYDCAMSAFLAATNEVVVFPSIASGSWTRVFFVGVQTFAVIGAIAGVVWLLLFFSGSKSSTRVRPSQRVLRVRMVLGLLAVSGMTLWMPLSTAPFTLSPIHPAWVALFVLLPLISLGVMAHDFVWLARFWRPIDPWRCQACDYSLLAHQSICPECGTSRATNAGRVQARVHARFALALLCALGASYGVTLLGSAPLRWNARLLVELEDEHWQGVATIAADAIVYTSVIARESAETYGPDAIVRDVYDAAAVPVLATSIPVSFIPILPSGSRTADDAWFASLPTALASFPPASATAAESWARTVTARCAGTQAEFAPMIARVETWVDITYPPTWATIATLLSGPLTVLVGFSVWTLLMRRVRRLTMA